MHLQDVPYAISGQPFDSISVLEGPYTTHGYTIHDMELRLYTQSLSGRLRHTITAYIRMDGHTVETIHHTAYGRRPSLQDAADFLTFHVGPSGTILRAKIALEAALGAGKV